MNVGQSAFSHSEQFCRSKSHMLAQLVCLGRHTITALLCCNNRQHEDWTADYRHYSQGRAHPEVFLARARQSVEERLSPKDPFVGLLDDSVFRKTGLKTPGVAWQRDPLSPPFHVNLIRAQRVLQISAALPCGDGKTRAIPIDFHHALLPIKPNCKAPPEVWREYRAARKVSSINLIAAKRTQILRQKLDEDRQSGPARKLIMVVDNRFTNRAFGRNLPERTSLVGRLRKDASLYYLPQKRARTGRKRIYGKRAPTPKALHEDQSIPWQKVQAQFQGQTIEFQVKVLEPLVCRMNGGKTPVRLIVVAPLERTATPRSKSLFHKRTQLISSDLERSVQEDLQDYLGRWDVEVNLRDEKTLLGAGEAQVRNLQSIEQAPALAVAAYSLLLLASIEAYGPAGQPDEIELPKWRENAPPQRATTNRLINQLRLELWGDAIKQASFSGFSNKSPPDASAEKLNPNLCSSLFQTLG